MIKFRAEYVVIKLSLGFSFYLNFHPESQFIVNIFIHFGVKLEITKTGLPYQYFRCEILSNKLHKQLSKIKIR